MHRGTQGAVYNFSDAVSSTLYWEHTSCKDLTGTGIEKNIDNAIKDLDRVMIKFSATFPILSSAKSPQSRKKKESSAKVKRRKIRATEARKNRACFIFLSLGGSPINNEYDPSIYGIQQVEEIDYDTLSLFSSGTDKACLRDLLNSREALSE